MTNNMLDNWYTFDNYLKDDSNKLAFYSAMEVSVNPGNERFNPLYIYAETGMGKTHLLQGIGLALQENEPNLAVIYNSANRIVDELIDSIRNGMHSEFKKEYRQCDVLLIDDIQSLSEKKSTQDEIFYMLNDLLLKGKQVVVTCNCSPMELKGFNDKLLSVFKGGVVVDVQKSDKNFLKELLEMQPFAQDSWDSDMKEVIDYIIDHFNNNNGEALGALRRVTSFCDLMSVPVNLDNAKDILEGQFIQRESAYEPIDMEEEDLFLLTASELERMIEEREEGVSGSLFVGVNSINKSIIKQSNRIWNVDDQLFVCVEELSELIQAISKMRRGRGVENLIEEIADVYIMLENLKDQYSISEYDVGKSIQYKIERLEEKMDNTVIGKGDINDSSNDSLSSIEVLTEDGTIKQLDVKTINGLTVSIPAEEKQESQLILHVTDESNDNSASIDVIGESIFRVLVKLDRLTALDVTDIVETIYFDVPDSIKTIIIDDYNFKSLYSKLSLPTREKYYPDGMK